MSILINPLKPNGHYSGRTASLTSRRCILNIYSTISVLNVLNMLHSLRFLLQNAVYFIMLPCLVPVFFDWFCMLHYNNRVILHAITYKFRFTWFEIPLRYIFFYSFSKSIDSKKFRNVSRCVDIRCCLLGGHCPAFMALFLIFCRCVSSRVQR
jgi:hypothetical protein